MTALEMANARLAEVEANQRALPDNQRTVYYSAVEDNEDA
jgi:hypothetical protein